MFDISKQRCNALESIIMRRRLVDVADYFIRNRFDRNKIVDEFVYSRIICLMFLPRKNTTIEEERDWIEEVLFFLERYEISLNDLPNEILGQILKNVVSLQCKNSIFPLVSLYQSGSLRPERAFEAGLLRIVLQNASCGLINELITRWEVQKFIHVFRGVEDLILLDFDVAIVTANSEGNHKLDSSLRNLLSLLF